MSKWYIARITCVKPFNTNGNDKQQRTYQKCEILEYKSNKNSFPFLFDFCYHKCHICKHAFLIYDIRYIRVQIWNKYMAINQKNESLVSNHSLITSSHRWCKYKMRKCISTLQIIWEVPEVFSHEMKNIAIIFNAVFIWFSTQWIIKLRYSCLNAFFH